MLFHTASHLADYGSGSKEADCQCRGPPADYGASCNPEELLCIVDGGELKAKSKPSWRTTSDPKLDAVQ